MGRLLSMEILTIKNAGLIGLVPSSIFNITSLKQLNLDRNNLSGVIPQEIGNLHNLKILALNADSLKGPIPSSIYNISTIQMISLCCNRLSGNLPSSMGLWLPNLEKLYLGGNNLSGFIPQSISNASKLTILFLPYNEFIGPIPKSLSHLGLLQHLNLGDNHFITESSFPEMSLFTSLANCRHLRVLWIYHNPLKGLLPVSIGNLSNSLENIDASFCGIKGTIPNEIEYGREGLLSTRCDVYSYGIMLMETFTRMKPTDEMFTGEMSLKHWVNESLPNAIIQIVDANLLRPEEKHFSAKVQSVSSVMELALDCCAESPQERINMNDVEATLRKIRLKLLANLEAAAAAAAAGE
ncbi:hypothetical protein F0562_013921 [Nyssa sinensis]|uniref:Serine-threonine/tyrosine-protein kinase catalytic domain-containing protein n=1 Tax=Nyssa sinensis TaxID=561372 RepID=A0A5J4ZP59_9ASTE|nr:hypothetical protein F0562_013921 [Nyssa sinensis]